MKILTKTVLLSLVAATLLVSCSKKSQENKAENGTAETTAAETSVNAKKITDTPVKCFKYTLTEDGTGVKITGVVDLEEPYINVPATIEGLPVKEFDGNLKMRLVDSILGYSFPDTVTYISTYANIFQAGNLKYLKLPASLNGITDWEGQVVDMVTGEKRKKGIPLSLKNIEGDELVIPEGVEYINLYHFNGKKIVLPSTIKVFIASAGDLPNLSEIVIPESVTSITFDLMSEENYNSKYREKWTISGHSFKGTKLNLATQAKLKKLGYKGEF